MSVLDTSYKDTPITTGKIWCDEDRHALFEYFTDFNEWIDGDDGQEIRERYGVDDLSQPNKSILCRILSLLFKYLQP